MTTPTLTCDHCDSEIDIAKDRRCVLWSYAGGRTEVMCESCRERAFDRWQEDAMAGDGPSSLIEQQREAYRIKRGWQA